MSRNHVSTEDLKKMAYEHLSYEVEMFTSTMGRLNKGGLDMVENNVMLESFLVHARCLFDFLYPSSDTRPNDVVSDDYFGDPTEFRKKLPPSLSIESYLKHRTGKEIVHLTYDRLKVTPEKKVWQVSDVHNQIVGALEIFFSSLSSEQRGWFRMIVSGDGCIGE
jgi:hypothetical protein